MSIRLKLLLSFLLVALVGVAIVGLLAGRATTSEFGQFVFRQGGEEIAAEMAEYYRTNGSWEGLQSGHLRMMGQGRRDGPGGVGRIPTAPLALVDKAGVVVLPGGGLRHGQQVPRSVIRQGIAIEVEGDRVGTLVAGGAASELINPAGQEFLARVNRALFFGGAVAVVAALLLAALLSGQLTGALRRLTEATRSLAAGRLGEQVEIRSSDEVGELASAFNSMSQELAEAERRRRQMTADIAHELRTPLSLILGQSEALLDEVVPPDEENLHVLHQEAHRLNRIVEDLRTLSLAEAGKLKLHRGWVDPAEMVRRCLNARKTWAMKRGLHLSSSGLDEVPEILADSDRLEQALGNLVDNAMRHSPEGGRIWVRGRATSEEAAFVVEDEGPGIDSGDLPHIFDRFYRADEARSRQHGGSGLGLAIARSIARSHGGEINVENRVEGGARFVLTLPIAGNGL
ncbi:MAG: sensor histidine kinase [Anaerolineales bacterium]